ncbi:hypothetical protein GCM10027456_50290 [Kineosporia babensis]
MAGAAASAPGAVRVDACEDMPIEATRPPDMAITAPPRPITDICPVTAVPRDVRGVAARTGARWRAVARVVTVYLSGTPTRSAVGFGWEKSPGRIHLIHRRCRGFTPRTS